MMSSDYRALPRYFGCRAVLDAPTCWLAVLILIGFYKCFLNLAH